jgi:hypothetical protein
MNLEAAGVRGRFALVAARPFGPAGALGRSSEQRSPRLAPWAQGPTALSRPFKHPVEEIEVHFHGNMNGRLHMSLLVTAADLPPDVMVRKALEALRARFALKRCQRCDADAWAAEIYSTMVAVPVGEGMALPGTSAQVPVLAMTCTNCGWLNLHSLKMLGLVK